MTKTPGLRKMILFITEELPKLNVRVLNVKALNIDLGV